MEFENFILYKNHYKKALLDNVMPFWEKHSPDWEHGGYFTCLDRKGSVYDTDKFSWLQARQVWTFSMLYNKVEQKDNWLKIAENGIRFLIEHGRDSNGSFYFSFKKDGQPLTHAFNIYSDCFAAIAFAEYGKATGEDKMLEIGRNTYFRFLERQKNPKGRFEKTTGTRSLKSFGLPMMTAFLTYEMEDLVGTGKSEEIFEDCIHQILNVHYNPNLNIINEHVGPDGERLDCFDGRLVNPGHGIEAMWFLMDVALRLGRKDIIEKATDICLQILEFGWDKRYGGIFYFMDSKGAPLQQLEWDQKLWWVHQEALIALSKAYLHTGRADVWKWYEKVHDYSWNKFYDPEYGEWYGYLNGGKWKGCFHTPRAMYECWKNFEELTKLEK
jgi:N-acylglucosamine 2-epimerase